MTIHAKENTILTNGEIYAKSVRLGDWDSPDNWQEMPIEEYNKIMTEDAEADMTT